MGHRLGRPPVRALLHRLHVTLEVRAGLGLAPYQVTLADAAVRQPA